MSCFWMRQRAQRFEPPQMQIFVHSYRRSTAQPSSWTCQPRDCRPPIPSSGYDHAPYVPRYPPFVTSSPILSPASARFVKSTTHRVKSCSLHTHRPGLERPYSSFTSPVYTTAGRNRGLQASAGRDQWINQSKEKSFNPTIVSFREAEQVVNPSRKLGAILPISSTKRPHRFFLLSHTRLWPT